MKLQIVVSNLFCYECKQTFSNSNSFQNHQHRLRRRLYSHHETDNSSSEEEEEQEEDEENEQVDSDESYSPPTKVYGACPKKKRKVQPPKGVKVKTKYQDENFGRKSPVHKSPTDISDSSEEEEQEQGEENEQVDSEDSYSPTKKLYGTLPKNKSQVQPSKEEKVRTKYQDENLGRKSLAGDRKKVESKSTLTSTSVLRTPLQSLNVEKFKDFMHCYKCFSTFYHLDDLALHFDKCTVPPPNSSFKNFKSNQGKENKLVQTTAIIPSFFLNLKKPGVKPVLKVVENASKVSPSLSTIDTELNPKPTEDLSPKAPDSQQEKQKPKSIYPSAGQQNIVFRSGSYKVLLSASPVSSTVQQKVPVKSEPKPDNPPEVTAAPDFIAECVVEDQSMNSPMGNDVNSDQDDDDDPESESRSKKGEKPQEEDPQNVELKCDTCGKLFDSETLLKRHLTRHSRSFRCPITPCTYGACEENILWIHMKAEHLEDYNEKYGQRYPCTEPNCTLAFPSDTLLRRHVGSHNPVVIVKLKPKVVSDVGPGPCLCSICGKTLASGNCLKRHMLTHQEDRERRFRCNYADCGKMFFTKRNLAEHSNSHYADKQFRCTEPGCTRIFTRSSVLRNHVNAVHLQIKPYKCRQCEETFSTSQHRQKHFVRQHRGRTFKCEVGNCDKIFLTSTMLKRHSILHNTEREKFKCPIPGCSAQLSAQSSLDNHLKVVHEGIKKYLCSYCGKSFGHSTTYRIHLRTHTKEKPYVCSVCGWAFTNNSMLKNHMLVHTGERPLKCSYCDKTFRASGSLKRHEQTHTGQLPYTCKFCDKAFPDNRPLKKHVQSVHLGEYEYDLGNPITYQSTPGYAGYSAPTQDQTSPASSSAEDDDVVDDVDDVEDEELSST